VELHHHSIRNLDACPKRRASERGFEDIQADVQTARHFARRDLAQALRNIRTDTSRSRGKLNRDFSRSQGDIQRGAERGERKIGEEESDVRLDAGRANQDFDTQLANIGRQFAQLGQRQGESANAAGVLGGGTQAAAQVARSRNRTVAESPVHTARQRVGEDLATALRGLGTAREDLGEDRDRELGELSEDRVRGLGQLHDDRDRTRRLSRRETKRKMFDLKRELERARREKEFSIVDLNQQAIYEALNNRPGAFSRDERQAAKRQAAKRQKKGKR
jgi:hypothetical protein